jgi:hypothetical protein
MFRSLLVLSPVLRGWCPLSSSTGLVPSLLQFYGVGAPSLQFYGVGALQFSGWRPPVLGLLEPWLPLNLLAGSLRIVINCASDGEFDPLLLVGSPKHVPFLDAHPSDVLSGCL